MFESLLPLCIIWILVILWNISQYLSGSATRFRITKPGSHTQDFQTLEAAMDHCIKQQGEAEFHARIRLGDGQWNLYVTMRPHNGTDIFWTIVRV